MAQVPFASDKDRQEVFLEELRRCGQIQHSADVAGVSRGSILRLRDKDPDFAAAIHEAVTGYFPDAVRNEMVRRAMVGWLEPVYGKEGRHYEEKRDAEGRPVLVRAEAVDKATKKLLPTSGDTGRFIYYEEYRHWAPSDFEGYACPEVPSVKLVRSDPLLLALARRYDPAFREGRDAPAETPPRSVDRERLADAIKALPAGRRRELQRALDRAEADDRVVDVEAAEVRGDG